jgi:hypothetical protein
LWSDIQIQILLGPTPFPETARADATNAGNSLRTAGPARRTAALSPAVEKKCWFESGFASSTAIDHKQSWGLLTRSIWRGLPPDLLQQPVSNRQVGEEYPTPKDPAISSEPNLWQLRKNLSSFW